jgi:predicted lipase
MNNFSVTMKELPLPGWGRAHEGFLQSYAAVAGAIRAGLGGLDGASRIYVAGHSLGAALATLALPDLGADLGGKMAGLYTFGSPRVGDAVFSRVYDAAFGARSFRIVNSSDIVTSVPLPVPIMGFVGDYFSHVSTPVEFGSQNGDPELNHAMKTYLEALEGSRPPEGWWRRVFAGGK